MPARWMLASAVFLGSAGSVWSQSQPPAVILDMRVESRIVYVADTRSIGDNGCLVN